MPSARANLIDRKSGWNISVQDQPAAEQDVICSASAAGWEQLAMTERQPMAAQPTFAPTTHCCKRAASTQLHHAAWQKGAFKSHVTSRKLHVSEDILCIVMHQTCRVKSDGEQR